MYPQPISTTVKQSAEPAKPLITVIITSYNYLHYIFNAIESARSQSYSNVEIVVVDNCSTDGTVPALRERYKDDPRVKIHVNAENLREIRNSNRGYELSTGEFVMWLSADDWMFPKHLERLHAVFAQEPEIDVVYSAAYFADKNGRVYTMRQLGGQLPVDYVDVRDELVEMWTTTCPLCWPSALFRHSVFEDVGVADPNGPVAADWEVQIRIAIAGKRFAYLAEPSTVIRLHDLQQTGAAYHAAGSNVMEFIAILDLYLENPAMERVRGREGGIVAQLDAMLNASKTINGGDPFTLEQKAVIQAMRMRLLRKAEAYEPARVRSRLISVLLPAAGPPQVLARAIASIAAQTFTNWEIVIVDHGTIPLEHWLRSLPEWSKIAYLRFPYALLPGTARNFAMRIARGEYLANLDEDNTFEPTHLESLVRTIESSGSDIVAAGSLLVIERSDRLLIDSEIVATADIFRSSREPAGAAGVAYSLPLNALLYYRRMQDRVGRFNESLPLLEDFEYVLRLEKGGDIAFSSEKTLRVRARLGLVGTFGSRLPQYVAVLDAIYGAHPAPAAAARRADHRAAVLRGLASPQYPLTTSEGVAAMLALLTGVSVAPASALVS